MTDVCIRLASAADEGDIIDVFHSKGFFTYLPSAPDRQTVEATVSFYLEEYLRFPKRNVFLVAELISIGGFATAHKRTDDTWEIQVGVHPAYRKNGIGGQLVAALINILRAQTPTKCRALIHRENIASMRIFSPFFHTMEPVPEMENYVRFTASW
ncbi:GNAT family N-acetyltransferase [Rhizobium beringeri]